MSMAAKNSPLFLKWTASTTQYESWSKIIKLWLCQLGNRGGSSQLSQQQHRRQIPLIFMATNCLAKSKLENVFTLYRNSFFNKKTRQFYKVSHTVFTKIVIAHCLLTYMFHIGVLLHIEFSPIKSYCWFCLLVYFHRVSENARQ